MARKKRERDLTVTALYTAQVWKWGKFEGGDLFGTSVQLAARLCSLAMPDCVLAAEAVYAAPGGHRKLLEPRGAFSPKGFDTPVQAFGLVDEAR